MIEVNRSTTYNYIYTRGVYMKKNCTGCNVEKFFDEFGKDKKAFDGLNQKCKKCVNERAKKYVAPKEVITRKKKYQSEWQKQNRERLNDKCREHYLNNLEQRREYLKVKQKEYMSTEKGKEKHRERNKKYREDNPEKVRAQYDVANARKRGDLIRPSQCDKCLIECTPHAHHEDYTKTLDVIWLCSQCHLYHHQGNKFHRERLSELDSE